jgi:hypothetical protein
VQLVRLLRCNTSLDVATDRRRLNKDGLSEFLFRHSEFADDSYLFTCDAVTLGALIRRFGESRCLKLPG